MSCPSYFLFRGKNRFVASSGNHSSLVNSQLALEHQERQLCCCRDRRCCWWRRWERSRRRRKRRGHGIGNWVEEGRVGLEPQLTARREYPRPDFTCATLQQHPDNIYQAIAAQLIAQVRRFWPNPPNQSPSRMSGEAHLQNHTNVILVCNGSFESNVFQTRAFTLSSFTSEAIQQRPNLLAVLTWVRRAGRVVQREVRARRCLPVNWYVRISYSAILIEQDRLFLWRTELFDLSARVVEARRAIVGREVRMTETEHLNVIRLAHRHVEEPIRERAQRYRNMELKRESRLEGYVTLRLCQKLHYQTGLYIWIFIVFNFNFIVDQKMRIKSTLER